MGTEGKKVAFVTGATGIQGRAVVKRLGADDGWAEVVAVARRDIEFLGMEEAAEKVKRLKWDLLDPPTKLERQAKELKLDRVTHIFHLAFAGDTTNRDLSVAVMLDNVVTALEGAGAKLQHVYFAEGIKYYGFHLGPDHKTPYRESDPRHMFPNYYYALEDYVERRQKEGAKWTWSTMRPGAIVGFSLGTMNLLHAVAVYATISKELDLPLRFPGSMASYYKSVLDCVDVDLLADAEVWAATHEAAANTAFNIHNGDVFRWCEVWPAIAQWFKMPLGPPLKMPLEPMMTTPEKPKLWAELVQKHGLRDVPYNKIVRWEFGDAMFNAGDAFGVTTLLRKRGYHGQNLNTDEMFVNKLNELATLKVIPNYHKGAVK